MIHFFTVTIYEPIYNALIALYAILGNDLGIAIITLTIIIKIALFGMSKKQIASQKEMQEIQPKIKELQKKYKDDREKLARETMAIYKEHKINPAAGCLPLIVQLIIFIALYRVIINLSQNDNFTVATEHLYAFVPQIDKIKEVFLPGTIDMSLAAPSYILAIVTAAAQYYQIKMMQARTAKKAEKKEETKPAKKAEEKTDDAPNMADFAEVMQKQMLVIIPAMTLFIGVTFPAGLTLYWLTSTLFMIGQQHLIMKPSE